MWHAHKLEGNTWTVSRNSEFQFTVGGTFSYINDLMRRLNDEMNKQTDATDNSTEKLHDLREYDTGDVIRKATAEEVAQSDDAAKHDGGAGCIMVDGRVCYTTP